MADVLIQASSDDRWSEVVSPFEARDIIKSFPGSARKWDPDKRCWLMRSWLTADLAAMLENAGFTVKIVKSDPAPTRVNTSSWADQLYVALGLDLGDKAFHALIRVLHPDMSGGNTTAMQTLNRARDRAHGKNSRGTAR
jgi:hypothetical protein